MNSLFGDLLYDSTTAYIDDILIHAPDEETLVSRIVRVLHCLRVGGGKIKLDKMEISPSQFEYLGHYISEGIRMPQPKKLFSYH